MSAIQQLTSASQNKQAALTVLSMVGSQHAALLKAWQDAMDVIWDSPDPAGIIAELGNRAAALFEISAQTCVFLESIEPGCNLDRRLKIWPHTIHSDGSITVVPPPR